MEPGNCEPVVRPRRALPLVSSTIYLIGKLTTLTLEPSTQPYPFGPRGLSGRRFGLHVMCRSAKKVRHIGAIRTGPTTDPTTRTVVAISRTCFIRSLPGTALVERCPAGSGPFSFPTPRVTILCHVAKVLALLFHLVVPSGVTLLWDILLHSWLLRIKSSEALSRRPARGRRDGTFDGSGRTNGSMGVMDYAIVGAGRSGLDSRGRLRSGGFQILEPRVTDDDLDIRSFHEIVREHEENQLLALL